MGCEKDEKVTWTFGESSRFNTFDTFFKKDRNNYSSLKVIKFIHILLHFGFHLVSIYYIFGLHKFVLVSEWFNKKINKFRVVQ